MRRVICRAAVVVVGIVAILGWQQPADAEPSTIELAGTASKSSYQEREPVGLNFTVTNAGPAPCRISSTADGVLSITAVSVDGRPVQPSLGYISYTDSLASQLAAALRSVPAGGSQSLSLGPVGDAGLQSVSLAPAGQPIVARWSTEQPGNYTVTAIYLYPPTLSTPADACRGMSSPDTVSFTVDVPEAEAGSASLILIIVGGVVLLLLVFLVIWFVRRKSRANAAISVAMVALVTTALAVVMAVNPPTAQAKIVVHPEAPPGVTPDPLFAGQVEGCMRSFRSEDGSGDPLKILPWLDTVPQQVHIWKSDKPRSETVGIPAADATNGKGANSGIGWNPNESAPYLGGIAPEKCSELYHELFHAYQNARGQSRPGNCTGAGGQAVPLSELDATMAENAYRRYRGLDERIGYGNTKFSDLPKDCQPTKPKPTKRPKPNGSDSSGDADSDTACTTESCGGSNGDPHRTTFDRKYYDRQAAGEFIAVTSTAGDLEVQVRQVPFPGSAEVSVNRAVAMNVAGDRVGVYQDSDQVRLRINGAVTPTPQGVAPLPRGGRIVHIGGDGRDAYLVTWPDGSRVWAGAIGGWGLRIDAELAAARKGAVQGLLGNFDGRPDDDLAVRNGPTLGEQPGFDQLYQQFAQSWRVAQSESLFDYEPNQNTQTFTIEGFPAREIRADSLAARAAAEAICRSMNVTGSPYLENCMLDVALTGHADFAASAASEQAAIGATEPGAHRDPPPSQTPAPGAAEPLRDGSAVTGRITKATETQRFDLDLGDAKVFYVADWRGTTDSCDQTFSVNLVGVSHSNFPCTNGIVTFTIPDPARRYQLEIASSSTDVGPFSFTVITAKPRPRSAVMGAKVTGRLDSRGHEDVYELPQGTVEVTLTDTSGCDDDMFAEIHDLSAGSVVASSNPLCGNQIGPYPLPDRTHRYIVTIRSISLKTGPYTFTFR